uniref:Uncharacterized protein n=1 Tax=Arundo donax TaxID=35708 RepID=A0A0A8Z309_ARUDO
MKLSKKYFLKLKKPELLVLHIHDINCISWGN